jgi:hypothetical protein
MHLPSGQPWVPHVPQKHVYSEQSLQQSITQSMSVVGVVKCGSFQHFTS